MTLRLCFGTFIALLDLCKYNITQERLIAEIVQIIDPASRYIKDRTACNKLKKCQINFRLDSGYFNDVPSIASVKECMKNKIIPFIDENKITTIILSLLYTIQNESRNKTLKEEYLKNFFLQIPANYLQKKNLYFLNFSAEFFSIRFIAALIIKLEVTVLNSLQKISSMKKFLLIQKTVNGFPLQKPLSYHLGRNLLCLMKLLEIML